jgi:hypothetical protein
MTVPQARSGTRRLALCLLCLIWAAAAMMPGTASAQRDPGGKSSRGSSTAMSAGAIDFGDDASQWSNDGECDDPRFTGPGMTTTPLLDEDIMHDATDCRLAFKAGRLEVDFGNDNGQWSNDGECDDPRFAGPGMTTTTLLEADIRHDATDCRTAFEAGQLTLSGSVETAGAPNATPAPTQPGVNAQGVNFGDDNGQWSNDGECDDPRFIGPGMTTTTLLDDDIRHDATDCRTAYEAGRLSVNFGDDNGQWSNDGECDDPRFAGPGMTTTTLLDSDILHDATDCRTAFEAGQLVLQ